MILTSIIWPVDVGAAFWVNLIPFFGVYETVSAYTLPIIACIP